MNAKKALLSLILITLTSCGYPDAKTGIDLATIENTSKNISLNNDDIFELVIEQKKNNGEIISIGSKAVQYIKIDGFDFPLTRLVKNQLRIELPKLIPGKHDLEVSLYSVAESFTIPIIVPNNNLQKALVLLRLNINEAKKEVTKIEYGFDLDKNGIIDADIDKFESIGTKSFFVIRTDGKKEQIDLGLKDSKTLLSEQLPPGIVPSSTQQSGVEKNEIGQSQINAIEPPKPIIDGDGIYPVIPTSKTLVPINTSSDKEDK